MAEIEKKPVKVVETILRDAHQSLIATRMSTEQMLPIIEKLDKVGYYAVECWGGAGSLVPITGFANSVAASAIEFRAEGQVFGIGCKIFTIAGPVILYGILSAWGLGVIYYILKILEVIS